MISLINSLTIALLRLEKKKLEKINEREKISISIFLCLFAVKGVEGSQNV